VVEEASGEVVKPVPGEETLPIIRESDSGLEKEPEHPLGIHPTDELVEDGWWSPEAPQLGPEEDEEEDRHLMRVWGPRSQGKEPLQDRATGNLRGRVTAPDKPWEEQSPRPRGAKRRKLRKRMEKTRDQDQRRRGELWEIRGIRKVDLRAVQDLSTSGNDLRRGVFRTEEAGLSLRSS
jgi:hypothetical protein